MVNQGQTDTDSGRPQGVFQAAVTLRDQGEIRDVDRDELNGIMEWFERNLPGRRAFGSRLPAHAIFWFKASHHEVIRRAWQLVNLLRRYDMPVEMVKTVRPGRVVYEDEMQVAAVPWRTTPQS